MRSALQLVLLNLWLVIYPAWADGGFPGGHREALGDQYEAQPRADRRVFERGHPDGDSALRRWNTIAVDASGLDHTPVAGGEARVFGEQLGPARAVPWRLYTSPCSTW